MIAMLPSSSLGNEVTFHFLYHLDACGDGCVDVKGKIETTEEWTKIRLFKVGLTFRIKAVEYLPISSGTYLFGKCSRWSVVLKIHYE